MEIKHAIIYECWLQCSFFDTSGIKTIHPFSKPSDNWNPDVRDN